MSPDHSFHHRRNVRSGSHHVSWADVAVSHHPRQVDPEENGLVTDPFVGDGVSSQPNSGPNNKPSGPSSGSFDPSRFGPRPPPSPVNAAEDPVSSLQPSTSQLPEDPTKFNAGASLLPDTPAATAQYVPLGLDVDPWRPPIIAILSTMGFIIVLLFVLLLIMPLSQSKRRRYQRVAHVSENERRSMAVAYDVDPLSSSSNKRPPILSLHLDESEMGDLETPRRHYPPGLQLAAAVGMAGRVPLAPPSPRSGGLPSNPRSGLPTRSPTLRSNTTSPGAPFRSNMLRPSSGVVTWTALDPIEDYNRAWGGAENVAPASHLRPPKTSAVQTLRNSIVSTFSLSGLRGSKARNTHVDVGQMRWESMIPEEGETPYGGDFRKAWM